MKCRIDRDSKGNILKVYDQNGQESQLFKEFAQVPGTTLEEALEQYMETIEPEIEFVRADINKGLTSHMFKLGDEKVGTIRTKPYKDGVKVDQALVTEVYRGQGVGTELYLETIRNLMIEGKKLYSDNSRTAPAEAIWQKLVKMNLAIQNEDGTYETVSPVGTVTEETTIDEIIGSLSTYNSDQLTENTSRSAQLSVVTDLSGNQTEVDSSSITTYESEAGPIHYIIDGNGDMQMVRLGDQTVQELEQIKSATSNTGGFSKTNPNIYYRVGEVQTESYKEALDLAQGQDIEVGVITDGQFKLTEVRSSNLNPTTRIGWVNNVIAEGIVKEKQYVENGEALLEVEGTSAERRLANEEIVKEFALENNMKAEVNEDGTFRLKSLEVVEDYPDKEVVDAVYSMFNVESKSDQVFMESDSQLSQKILTFLEKIGFSVVSLDNYKKKYLEKHGTLPNAEALVDLANQVVAFKEGRITEEALTEEFVHLVLEGLPQEQLQPLLDQVHNTQEWADHYDTYMRAYNNNEAMVRKEILGKIVANGLIQKTQELNLFQQAWQYIKDFIDSVVKSGFQKDVDALTDRVHDLLVRQDASQLEDLSKRKFRMYRIDNTMPELVATAIKQLEEGERQLRTAGTSKYLINEAMEHIAQGRTELAIVNALDLARRQAKYVRQALEVASHNGGTMSGEERVVANNLKNVIQPIISRIRLEAETNPKLAKFIPDARDISDEITMLDTSVSDDVVNSLIDKLFKSNPKLSNMKFKGKTAREYFKEAFRVAESDTNFLFSMIGSIAHAKDVLLGILSKVLKDMTNRAHFGFHDDASKLNSLMNTLKINPDKLKMFYDKDGFFISAWDWATHNQKLNEAKKTALELAGIDYEGEFNPKQNYLEGQSADKVEVYRNELKRLRATFETKKYNQSYYEALDRKMKDLDISPKTMERITAFTLERANIMKNVQRDSKGRPIFTKRDIEALEAYNIERKKAKSFFDSAGLEKVGIKISLEDSPGALNIGGLFYTIDKDKASDEAKIAFEMHKYDKANAPESYHSGVTQFLDVLRGMSVSDAKAYVKANINMAPNYTEIEPEEVPEGKEAEYKEYKTLVAKRRAILNRFRDSKNASNILFHMMDRSTQEKVRELTELISIKRKSIGFENSSVEDQVNEFGVNAAYNAWIKEEGLVSNPRLEWERAMEHVPSHQKAYLNSMFNSMELLSKGYEVSSLEKNRIKREFSDIDPEELSEYTQEDIDIMKVEAVKKRLAPYFTAYTPPSYRSNLDRLEKANSTDAIIAILESMDNDPNLNLSMHYSFYEDTSADLNPNYQHDYVGGSIQPSDRNANFDKVLNLSTGSYTLDKYGIPVMKDGSVGTPELQLYRAVIEQNYKNLELQGEAGYVNLYQAPQVSRTSTDKIISALRGDTSVGRTAKEMIRELKNFRIDDLAIGEVDQNGEALAKQGIRVVPKRFTRQLEDSQDVTDDIFFSLMLMTKESHLHKARKESVSQVMALEQAVNNRKYNNTNKQAQSTNTAKMFKSFVDSNIYGISEVANYKVNLPFVGTTDLAKVSKVLHKYVRDRNLAHNLIVPMTSWVTAEVGLMIEGWVNQYIDSGSVRSARKELGKLTPEAFKESFDVVKTSKLSVIAERFDLFNMEQSYQNAKYTKGIRMMSKVAYMAHTGANYSPIMTALLGSLIGHRLYNNQFLNYEEFVEQVRTEQGISSKEAKAKWEVLERNSFYSYLSVGTGQNNLGVYSKDYQRFANDTGLSIEEATSLLDEIESDLVTKTQKISEVIDGNIRPEERSIAQRHFLLSFLTTHKGWMSIALARRFKDGHYNTSTHKWEEGHYITALEATKKTLNAMVKFKGSPSQIMEQLKQDWAEADPVQRKNMVRILIEMGVISGLFAMLLMMVGFADDEENRDNSTLQFSTYIMERLVNETRSSQFGLGSEIMNTIQDPVVGFKELRKLLDVSNLFSGEEAQNGRYKGLSGTESYLLNAIPGGKAMHTIWSGENIHYQRQAYQLYNGADELQPLAWLIDTDDAKAIYNGG